MRKTLAILAWAFLMTLGVCPRSLAQVIGIQPTPMATYYYDLTSHAMLPCPTTGTQMPNANTPQAIVATGFNSSLGQWIPTNGCSAFSAVQAIAPTDSVNCTPLVNGQCTGAVSLTVVPGSALSIEHDGAAVTDQAVLNFLDSGTTPGGYTDVTFATDSAGGLWGYVPTASLGGDLTFQPVSPLGGTCPGTFNGVNCVVIYPTAAALIQGTTGPGCGSFSEPTGSVVADTTSATPHSMLAGNTICGNGFSNNQWGVNWTFANALATQAPWVVAANVSSAYAFSFNSFGPFYPGTSVATVTYTQTGGGGSIQLQETGQAYPLQQFTGLLTTVSGTNIDATTATAYALYSTAPAGDTTLNVPSTGIMVYYTGTAPPASTAVIVAPPLYYNPSTLMLGIDPSAVFAASSLVGYTVSQLPAAAVTIGRAVLVTDASTSSTCGTGGGTNQVVCYSNGTSYSNIGGGSGGSSVSVNGGSTITSPNFGATPTAPTNGINITWAQGSGGGINDVSAALVGDGVSTHFLNGAGGFTTPAGSSSSGVWHSGTGAPSQGTAGTITHVQGTSQSGGSCTKAYGSSVTSGDLLTVLQVGETGMTTSFTPTDTVGTTFFLLGSSGFGGGTVNTALWGGYAGASGANTITWPSCGSVTNPTFTQEEFAGATVIIDQGATQVLNTANPSTPLTPSLSGDLIIGFGGWLWSNGTALSWTAGSGFTLGADVGGSADVNPTISEYLLGGGTSSTAVAISQTGNTGTGAAWNGVALYATHTGSLGSDNDFYIDMPSGVVYGPRTQGLYFEIGAGLGLVAPDGSTVTRNSDGVLSAPGGGGGGGWTKLSQVVVSSPVSTISFGPIAGTYSYLVLYLNGQSSSGSDDFATMQFNSDTSADYNISGISMSGASTVGAFTTLAGNAAFVVNLKSSSSGAHPGTGNCTISNYAGTTFNKQWVCSDTENKTSNMNTEVSSGEWLSTSAVTAILLQLNSGSNFVTGTTATLYGVP